MDDLVATVGEELENVAETIERNRQATDRSLTPSSPAASRVGGDDDGRCHHHSGGARSDPCDIADEETDRPVDGRSSATTAGQ